jgi:hypothetical protein
MATRRLFDGAQIEIGSIPIQGIPTPSISSIFWIKITGVWKQAITWIKIAGVWKQATPYVKIGGNWK